MRKSRQWAGIIVSVVVLGTGPARAVEQEPGERNGAVPPPDFSERNCASAR